MIHILLEKQGGGLARLVAKGHAGWEKPGKDIVCASATALMRSAARAAASRFPGSVAWEAPEPGVLLVSFPGGAGEWLDGLSAVLQTGLEDLQREFPRSLKVEIAGGAEAANEVSHGT